MRLEELSTLCEALCVRRGGVSGAIGCEYIRQGTSPPTQGTRIQASMFDNSVDLETPQICENIQPKNSVS